MIFWLDAQLPPQLALWLAQHFQVDAHPIRDLGLRDATDRTMKPVFCKTKSRRMPSSATSK